MILSNENKERIYAVQQIKWIGYTKANEVLKMMDMLLAAPRSHRMTNLLIIGDTNNGKTLIGKRFLSQNPVHFIEAEDPMSKTAYQRIVMDVMMIQCPTSPSERKLYISILQKLSVPYRESAKIEYLQSSVINGLQRLGVKILILDELHNILIGSAAKEREFLTVIKYLANELELSIVGIGTKSAFYVINSDDQLANRFDRVLLSRWKNDTEYLRLLITLEQQIKLKKASNLAEKGLSNKILVMSEGLIGEIVKIVRIAAIRAIETETEQITLKILDEIKWTLPSKRRELSELEK